MDRMEAESFDRDRDRRLDAVALASIGISFLCAIPPFLAFESRLIGTTSSSDSDSESEYCTGTESYYGPTMSFPLLEIRITTYLNDGIV
jgi:hypothetical protein